MAKKDLLDSGKKIVLMNLAKHSQALLSVVEESPRSIELALTSRCNLRCVMCNYWKLPTKDELTTNEAVGILGQASEMGVRSCTLYGGEPMLRRDIFHLVERASSFGMRVGMVSNGYYIDKKNAKRLSEAGLVSVSISIDGVGKIHDKIRGVEGAFRRAVQAACECRNNGIRVQIGAVLMKPTVEDMNIVEVVRTLGELGFATSIQLLDFSAFYFRDNPLRDQLWVKPIDQDRLDATLDMLTAIKKRNPKLIENSIPILHAMRGYFRDPKRADVPCYLMGMGRLWVDSCGKLYVCQSLPAVGDLRAERLKTLISSAKYRNRVRRAFMKQCPGCGCAFSFNISTHIPTMWKYFLSTRHLYT